MLPQVLRSFADNMGQWAWWNGLLLTVAHTATRLGAARKGGATQHEQDSAQPKPGRPECWGSLCHRLKIVIVCDYKIWLIKESHS